MVFLLTPGKSLGSVESQDRYFGNVIAKKLVVKSWELFETLKLIEICMKQLGILFKFLLWVRQVSGAYF